MHRTAVRLSVALVFLALASGPAFGQAVTTSTITGTVADKSGGVIPGATVVVTNEAGAKFQAVTNGEGVFSIPALNAGGYRVDVSLSGFKTWTSEVRLSPNTPVSLKVQLEVGGINETVTVATSAELVNTQTATISSTLNADQLNRMPTPTRNALNAVTFLPGVNTPGVARDSTVNGLPQSMINITLDGMSNNDNFLKTTDGFFASVTPRQDAVEAVTVTTAVQGVSSGGGGGVTIGFQTRSGTNRYGGSGYDYWRNPALNTNYWFNIRNGLPKNQVKVFQYGGRFGGPIVLPGYDGHNKAFFFAHYEQTRFPNSFTRTRTVLVPDALDGWFFYNVAGEVRKVNLLDLARANGQTSAKDPLVMSVLTRIADATKKTGVVNSTSNPLVNAYVWQSPGRLFEHQPTVRFDFNIGAKHRLSASGSSLTAQREPDYLNSVDARFPGAPNWRFFRSTRPLYAATLRSVLSPNMVNELRGGLTAVGGAGSRFGYPSDPNSSIGSFSDTQGMALVLPNANITQGGTGLTSWHATTAPSWRAAPTYDISESLNWQKTKHAFSLGGSFLRVTAGESAQTLVPSINFGVDTANDPANAMFSNANFAGAASGDLSAARDQYAILTGRISSVTGQAALDPATNKYVAFGPRKREGFVDVWSAYVQDTWRVKPTVTINAGVRYDVQLPFTTKNDTMSTVTMTSVCGQSGLGDGGLYSKCAFFQPGKNTGAVPQYIQYTKGTKGYNTDWNNVSPSVSVAWRPNVSSGFMKALLGDPDQATLRAGYSETFDREGLSTYTDVYGGNPGSTLSLSRTAAIGNLVLPGESWPILLSQPSRIYNAAFPETPTFPIAVRAGRADSVFALAPDVVIASARSWTLSFQRSISRDMAVDIRYVGTRGVNQWSTNNYNARDFEGNRFIDEFMLGVQNLKANNAAGGTRTGSFAYFGPGTGTSPLPTYLAYINGRTNASDPTAYTGTNWTNSTIAGRFTYVRPDPGNSATDLDGSATFRANALTAGVPANFFVLNPAVNAVNITDSGAFSNYHALQIDVRRRLSKGLSANVNYQFAHEGGSSFLGFRYGRVLNPTSDQIRHAVKTDWDWSIPVGRGHRFLADANPVVDGIVGGWSFIGVGRVQARMQNFGNVRLIGMTQEDLQGMYKFDVRVDPATNLRTVYMMPDDVILNTRRAFSFSNTSLTGYGALGVPEGRYIAPANSATCVQLKTGDCAPRTLMLRAPFFWRFDVGLSKRFPLKGRSNIEFRLDMLNIFNAINFNPVANPGSGATIFQATSAYTDASNTYDPGGRIGQMMLRVNW